MQSIDPPRHAGFGQRYNDRVRAMLFVGSVVLLQACATPSQQFDRTAQALALSRLELQGQPYRHVAYRNRATDSGSVLHVYIEGDGTPWLYTEGDEPSAPPRYWIAADPTPRRPIMLQLMAEDRAPSLFLGRPCYHGLTQSAGCNPLLWTHERYSPQVIESMVSALRQYLSARPDVDLVLLGHSGGGTLAMLMAPHFARTKAVVTLAGNLDTAAWTEYHRYSPLAGSLNPATQAPLPTAVLQLHLIAANDSAVPYRIVEPMLSQQPGAIVDIVPDIDHTCCWEKHASRLRNVLAKHNL